MRIIRVSVAAAARRIGVAVVWAACGLGSASGAAAAADVTPPLPARPSAERFFQAEQLGAALLSPSGQQLALTVERQGRVALAVYDLARGSAKVVAAPSRQDIGRVHWVGEHRLVYDLLDRQSGSGDQRSAPGLWVVDVRDGSGRMLIKPTDSFLSERAGPGRQALPPDHRLLAVPDDDSGELVIGKPVWGSDQALHEMIPLRVHVDSLLQRSLGQAMPDGVTQWLFDRRGEPRLGLAVRGGQARVHWRDAADQPWRLLATMPSTRMAWAPHAVDDQGRLLVTVAEGPAGESVLRRLDLATGQPSGDPLVSTPGFDFRGHLVLSDGPGERAALGVRVTTDAETTHWFDPRAKAWQDEADQRLPGRVNRLSCRRCHSEEPVLLVWSWSDRDPGSAWVFRPDQDAPDKRWVSVGRRLRGIEPAAMATVDFLRLPTRDGASMPVWLTWPQGASAATATANPTANGPAATPVPRRPAVVLVHGGPWLRGGDWRWEPMAQFLAAHGWLVLAPEFRGSTGYGARWFEAGRRQWGLAMQDDLADALRWAVDRGWVDPSRVCIAGNSYGGYAALMGPIRHPELYRCAVSWIGVTDLMLLFDNGWWSDQSRESTQHTLPALLGDPKTEAERLKSLSPVHRAAQLKVPVLLAWGGEDRRVQPAHGERMRDALSAVGRPPQWVVYPDEAHGWLKPENRIDWAQRMARFLAEHLDAPAPPSSSSGR